MAGALAAGGEFSRRASLRYLNLFRLILAGFFLVLGRGIGLGAERPLVFLVVAAGYLGAVLALGFPDAMRRLGIDRAIMAQVVIDVVALALIMWTSGGYRSGMPVLMTVMLAGAGLVAEGRAVPFFAAVATIAVLAENVWRMLAGAQPEDFFQVGISCAGFFAVALLARLLALRAQSNASLAAARGRELARQEEVNERIIRDMQDGVIVADADGRVQQANPQAAVLLGMVDEAGEPLSLDGRRLAELDPLFEEMLRGTPASADRLLRGGPGGRLLRCRAVLGAPQRGADALFYITDFEDIQRRLQQIKLAALGRLTASMAHEIRNPLAAVTQAAELLGDEDRAEVRARLLRIIGDNAGRIERMIREVLALGRRDRAAPEPLALAEFVDALIEERVFRAPGERALYANRIDPALGIVFDRAHLRQIIDNLLANACRYCSGAPASVQLHARALAGERVALHICDDGPGVDAEGLRHLFEPFSTTYAKGTGLGLYIARELAEANDATLELFRTGPGADFVLCGRSRT